MADEFDFSIPLNERRALAWIQALCDMCSHRWFPSWYTDFPAPQDFALIAAMTGEAGEALNKIKKVYRDGDTPERRKETEKEIADTFVYLMLAAKALNMSLPDAITASLQEGERRYLARLADEHA